MPGELQQRVAADRCGRGVCGERDWRSAWSYEQLVYNVVVQDASSSGTCIYVLFRLCTYESVVCQLCPQLNQQLYPRVSRQRSLPLEPTTKPTGLEPVLKRSTQCQRGVHYVLA